MNENIDKKHDPPNIRKPDRVQANTSHQKYRSSLEASLEEDDRPIDIVIGGTRVESSQMNLESQQESNPGAILDKQTLGKI